MPKPMARLQVGDKLFETQEMTQIIAGKMPPVIRKRNAYVSPGRERGTAITPINPTRATEYGMTINGHRLCRLSDKRAATRVVIVPNKYTGMVSSCACAAVYPNWRMITGAVKTNAYRGILLQH